MNKAEEFDEIARNVFAPIYPVLAQQIIGRAHIARGTCLDLGSGGGMLGLAVAAISELAVTLYDISPEAVAIAGRRIKTAGWQERVTAVTGDVHQMPFADGSFNLIISRGSLWFWEDHPMAFREIYRVLAPGGRAYLGGGFGTEELRRQIVNTMCDREDGNWEQRVRSYRKDHTPESITRTINAVGIEGCQVIDDESGVWFQFGKPELPRINNNEAAEGIWIAF
jgi:ubiquinone/menaquinone biosynthesis C-methylase UbiE